MTLRHVGKMGRRRKRKREEPGALSTVKRAKVQKDQVAKMSGLYREGHFSPWAGEVRVEGEVC